MIASGFKVGGSKGKCVATQGEFILICATSNRKIYINIFVSIFVGSNLPLLPPTLKPEAIMPTR
jgi:hypothetical protein